MIGMGVEAEVEEAMNLMLSGELYKAMWMETLSQTLMGGKHLFFQHLSLLLYLHPPACFDLPSQTLLHSRKML